MPNLLVSLNIYFISWLKWIERQGSENTNLLLVFSINLCVPIPCKSALIIIITTTTRNEKVTESNCTYSRIKCLQMAAMVTTLFTDICQAQLNPMWVWALIDISFGLTNWVACIVQYVTSYNRIEPLKNLMWAVSKDANLYVCISRTSRICIRTTFTHHLFTGDQCSELNIVWKFVWSVLFCSVCYVL